MHLTLYSFFDLFAKSKSVPPAKMRLGECHAQADICARGAQIWEQTFGDKTPSPRPRALVVVGVQGSGRSAACNREV